MAATNALTKIAARLDGWSERSVLPAHTSIEKTANAPACPQAVAKERGAVDAVYDEVSEMISCLLARSSQPPVSAS